MKIGIGCGQNINENKITHTHENENEIERHGYSCASNINQTRCSKKSKRLRLHPLYNLTFQIYASMIHLDPTFIANLLKAKTDSYIKFIFIFYKSPIKHIHVTLFISSFNYKNTLI